MQVQAAQTLAVLCGTNAEDPSSDEPRFIASAAILSAGALPWLVRLLECGDTKMQVCCQVMLHIITKD